MKRNKTYFQDPPEYPAPLSFTAERRICFGDVDALGIVWHGNYPRFIEQAVTELGHRIGLSTQSLKEANLAVPVAKWHIDYMKPLFLDEIIKTAVQLHWSEGPVLNLEMKIRNSAGEIACTGYIVQIFVSLDKREPLWFSPDIWENCKKRWKNGDFSHVS